MAGRHVLDVASGSGLVAIAAAIAGAAGVTANGIDPYSIAAISANAHANGVDLPLSSSDLLDGDGDGVDVVLTGDALYHPASPDERAQATTRPGGRPADRATQLRA